MNDRELKAEQVRARTSRMEDPRISRKGTISTGTKVRYCQKRPSCGPFAIADLEGRDRCPKCGGPLSAEAPGKLNYFRFYGFATDQEQELTRRYGPKPMVVPFTFPGHPAKYITLGRECYQGKFLHCCNHWVWDPREQKWVDMGKASRRVDDGMQRKVLDCRPDKCPFAIGTEDGAIKPGQCGEVVIANIWLYELDGWDLVRFKSGGINTINNFQDACGKLLVLTQGLGDPRSLKLELRIRSKSTKYPTPQGFKSTTINEVYIHWPNNPASLAKALSAGELRETDVYVVLPALGNRLALPEKGSEPEPQNTFDELVDGPRQAPQDEAERLPIADLPGRDDPPPVQATPMIRQDQLEEINELLSEYVRTKERKLEELKHAKRSIAYKGRTEGMTEVQGHALIDWLRKRRTQVAETAAKDAVDNAKSGLS